MRQIHDMAGIRVVVYLQKDRERVRTLVGEKFVVDQAESVDKGEELEAYELGYRGINLVCRLPEASTALSEWCEFRSMTFEVQIHTTLENAWSETEHGLLYKPGVSLPPNMERRIYLLAGLLEIADGQLSDLIREHAEHRSSVKASLDEGNLCVPITSDALAEYVGRKFPLSVKAGLELGPKSFSAGDEAFEWLDAVGLGTIAQLHEVLEPIQELDEQLAAVASSGTSLRADHIATLACLLMDPKTVHERAYAAMPVMGNDLSIGLRANILDVLAAREPKLQQAVSERLVRGTDHPAAFVVIHYTIAPEHHST